MNVIEEVKKLDLKELSKLCRMYPNLFKGYRDVPITKTKNFVLSRLKRVNKIFGGEGDNLTIDDVSLKELDMGIVIEYEHKRNDIFVSMDIDYDHLAELPDYYTRLYSMERQGKRFWNGKSKKKWIESEHRKMFRGIKD